ncbi:MAG TPA: glycosyltransferase family 39 protein [Candidatus Eisenbacteria bacterium]|nr:glycosyltransferase family 39 protein [Candidatus Eisenbacteria bacterium]
MAPYQRPVGEGPQLNGAQAVFSMARGRTLLSSLFYRTSAAPLPAVAALSLFMNLFWLWWGLPNGPHTWATDAIGPLQPLVAAKAMFLDDWWNSGYYNKFPMGHFFVLMAVYTPYIVYLYLTGGLANPTNDYPYGLSDPETALTVLSLLANATSALMGVGIVILIFLTARMLFGQRGAVLSALTIALSPPFIFYAHTSNVDTPHLFWCALGLFAFARLVNGEVELKNYLLLGFGAGMALGTKEQAYGLFILLPFPILALHIRHHLKGELQPAGFVRLLFDRKILWGFGISVLTFVLATHLIFNWDGNIERLLYRTTDVHPKWQEGYPGAPQLRGMGTSLFLERWKETIILLSASMNPVLFIASLAGLVYFPYKERWAPPFVVALCSYLFFVALQLSFIKTRFVMELILVLALFCGRFLAGVWSWSRGRRWAVAAYGLMWLYAFAYGFNVNYLMMRDARYQAEAWIRANLPAGARVETYSQPAYLPRLPRAVNSYRTEFDDQTVSSLSARSPDYVILTGAQYSRFEEGSPQKQLLDRLLRGDFGYRSVQRFSTEPLLGPNLIPGLSPEIIVLEKRPTLQTQVSAR